MRIVPILLSLIASGAAADCAQGYETAFHCTFNGGQKAVDVCFGKKEARYTFGPTGGAAELTLSTNIENLAYTPWPGVGRNIWEEVVFFNGDTSYLVSGVFEREFGETAVLTETVSGGIIVRQGDKDLANLTCDPGSVVFRMENVLYDAKRDAGFCWSQRSFEWEICE